MREIKLTRGLVALVSDSDFEMVNHYKWYANPCHMGSEGKDRAPKYYARSYIVGYMHRFILEAPGEYVVDHIDGNSLNNQRGNLRLLTKAENARLVKRPMRDAPFL